MHQGRILRALLALSLLSISPLASAWTQAIDFGYGYSHDPNNVHYNNSGFLLSSDVATLHADQYTHWSLNLAVGRWYSSAPINKYLTTGAASLELRLYPATCALDTPFYLLASAGPAIMSSNQFGTNTQASQASGQWIGGLGLEHKHFDINFHITHFSNAHIAKPDNGFNILYMLSVGYLFYCDDSCES